MTTAAPDDIRIAGSSWFFKPRTDRTEAEHRVDRFGAQLFCTCVGFVVHKHCKHSDRRRELEQSTDVALVENRAALPAMTRQNPAALAVRLTDMQENRRLTRQFFASVMEEGTDYGVIPGTDKPTLFKSGAEGLCELYGYAPTYQVDETKDLNTGFLRVVVTCTLVQRGTGEVVAQGLGECNTREARYFYRWMPEWEMKKFPELWNIRENFKKEERKWKDKKSGQQKSAIFFRTENDDLFTLWNTVLKMAKKRSHVDATLSATRSSGLFSQGEAALADWIEGDFEDVTDERPATATAEPRPRNTRSAPKGEPEPEKPSAPTPSQLQNIGRLINEIKESWGAASKDFLAMRDELVATYGQEKLSKYALLSYDEAASLEAYLRKKNGEPDEAAPEPTHDDPRQD